jgi:plasmid stabilization system protein ParE
MTVFILSPEAEQDLEVIKSYLVERSGARVARYVLRELRSGIQLLAKNLAAGHAREELTSEAVKFWAVFSYLIVYDPAKHPIEVVRVLHGRRNIERIRD